MTAAKDRTADTEPGVGEKVCPYCAEVIKAAAIKCRFCGEDLTSEPVEPVEPPESLAPELAAEEPAAQVPREPRHYGRAVVTACLVVLLGAAAAGLWLAARHADHADTARDGQLASAGARAAIMADAVRMTQQVMSYDAADSAHDIAAAERLMTPRARGEYEASLPKSKDRSAQAKLHITVTAQVASLTNAKTAAKGGTCVPGDCAVSLLSATPDSAEVMLFVNQSAQAHAGGKPGKNTVLSPTWEIVDLVRQDGAWLIDHLQSS